MRSSLMGSLYLKLLYPLMDMLALPYCLLLGRKRKVLKEEMERLFKGRFGNREIALMVKDSFRLYLKRQVENLFFGRFGEECLEDLTSVEGLENIEGAVKKGQGVILLLSHFGSFLIPLPLLGFRGFKVNQITGRVLSSGAVSKMIWKWRKWEADRLPIQFIGVAGFLRPVYDALKRGEIVAVAFDGREGKKWVPVRFIERTALFSPGPFNLALKTGAAIIPMFAIRQPDNRHRIIFMEEFELTNTGDINGTLTLNTKKYAEMLEKYVLMYPSHFGATLLDIRLNAENGLAQPLFREN
ncbi:MAG: lysophospholipid acyltransferase family protein [Deltaproteobacteria bacterium]|nr:lysophospholipid acyltransferase family protein [Deltaproteobacteria bacterium]